jgi:hypothetical protein
MRLISCVEGKFDLSEYLATLPALAEELPAGAYEYIADPAHFDFARHRLGDAILPVGTSLCTRDLKLIGLNVVNRSEEVLVVCEFVFPGYPDGQVDLRLEYFGVSSVELRESTSIRAVGSLMGPSRLGRWLIDEIMPSARGCTHEITFSDGTLTVDCADLMSTWR